jgi:hypothetical protein
MWFVGRFVGGCIWVVSIRGSTTRSKYYGQSNGGVRVVAGATGRRFHVVSIRGSTTRSKYYGQTVFTNIGSCLYRTHITPACLTKRASLDGALTL